MLRSGAILVELGVGVRAAFRSPATAEYPDLSSRHGQALRGLADYTGARRESAS